MTPEVLQAKIEARVLRLEADALETAYTIAQAQSEARIRESIDRFARLLVAAGAVLPPSHLRLSGLDVIAWGLASTGIPPPTGYPRPRLSPPR
jgi:hypothetical protein